MVRVSHRAVEGPVVLESLRRVGVNVNWDDLLAALTDAVDRMVSPPAAKDVQHKLTPREREALQSGGFDLAPESGGLDDALAQTAIEYATLVATSLNVATVARLLKVDDSRIRQRLTSRTLYGMKLGHAWHLPLFQFELEERRVVPGVERVFPRLRDDLHPIEVYTWFVSPDPDLVFENALVKDGESPTPMSPRDWLRLGGNPETVAAIAESL